MNHNLKELFDGGLQEKFDKSLKKVFENMQDPNMPYKDKRSITITLTFEQNESREDVKCNGTVKEKLAPQAAIETRFYTGKDLRSGEVYAKEYGKQLRGQIGIEDAIIDQEAGEIVVGELEQEEKVIDIRKTQEV